MADRRELARKINLRVVAHINRAAPPGLGHWEPAWGFVGAASDDYLDALAWWEDTGSREAENEVKMAIDAFVAAWRDAAEAWEAAGRPTAPEQRVAREVPA